MTGVPFTDAYRSMLNADLCFDADMRKMQCGLNAVINFVEMDKTGNKVTAAILPLCSTRRLVSKSS